MLRLFQLFGRSAEINALDDALRAAGVHPLLVPEAVKLTLIRLHKRQPAALGRGTGFTAAAELLAFCMLGRATFAESNTPQAADRVERRIEAAIDAGDSVDAKVILLALHAGLMAPDLAEDLDIDDS